ncbi:hypothetical protein QRQ56_15725 [Bradyrhizobium sp. U531]|uniref:hypothetical protein n=1 Tax=Bradyrhizobium sp. U531 TaxID=3053458 RepID=UPI003F423F5E
MARESIMMPLTVTIAGAVVGQIWKVRCVDRSEGRIVDAARRRGRTADSALWQIVLPLMSRSLPRIGARARGFVIAILVVRENKLSH